MRLSVVRLVLGAMLATALGGCGFRAVLAPTPMPTPPRALGPDEVWVPVLNWTLHDGTPLLCAGGGFIGEYLLHGSPTDPHVVWMTDPHGVRQELAWPLGYSARFQPGLELLNEHGDVVGREGTLAIGGCTTVDPKVQWVSLETPAPPPSEPAVP